MIINEKRSDTSKIFVELEKEEKYPETIEYTFYKKHKRVLIKTKCENCGQVFYKRKHIKTKFCSKNCQYANQRITLICDNPFCNKTFIRTKSDLVRSKSGLYFCSRECKDYAQRLESGVEEIHPSHYGNGAYNYRVKAFRELPNKCNFCGYSEMKKMLDVHHKDGNRSNNVIDNLEILCVWCHALKTRKEW